MDCCNLNLQYQPIISVQIGNGALRFAQSYQESAIKVNEHKTKQSLSYCKTKKPKYTKV